jgi:hypothetical protein
MFVDYGTKISSVIHERLNTFLSWLIDEEAKRYFERKQVDTEEWDERFCEGDTSLTFTIDDSDFSVYAEEKISTLMDNINTVTGGNVHHIGYIHPLNETYYFDHEYIDYFVDVSAVHSFSCEVEVTVEISPSNYEYSHETV